MPERKVLFRQNPNIETEDSKHGTISGNRRNSADNRIRVILSAQLNTHNRIIHQAFWESLVFRFVQLP
jgi:hypothetical protein